MEPEQAQHHLDRIRPSRSLPRKDVSLAFLVDSFKREVEKPFKQLGDLAELWAELLPEHLIPHCRLVGLSRGTLHVEADHAAAHFEIDRLLRAGLQTQLITQHRGPAFRKVSVKLARNNRSETPDPRRTPPAADSDPRIPPDRQPPSGRDPAR